MQALEAAVAGLAVDELVVAVEHVVRRDELVLEALDERVPVVDRARPRDLHRAERVGRDLRDIELLGAARLVDADDLQSARAVLGVPLRDFLGDVVADVAR